jgi:hypothetical protein
MKRIAPRHIDFFPQRHAPAAKMSAVPISHAQANIDAVIAKYEAKAGMSAEEAYKKQNEQGDKPKKHHSHKSHHKKKKEVKKKQARPKVNPHSNNKVTITPKKKNTHRLVITIAKPK